MRPEMMTAAGAREISEASKKEQSKFLSGLLNEINRLIIESASDGRVLLLVGINTSNASIKKIRDALCIKGSLIELGYEVTEYILVDKLTLKISW